MDTIVRVVFYISFIGFKSIITEKSGRGSAILAPIAKKPKQCNNGRQVNNVFLPSLGPIN